MIVVGTEADGSFRNLRLRGEQVSVDRIRFQETSSVLITDVMSTNSDYALCEGTPGAGTALRRLSENLTPVSSEEIFSARLFRNESKNESGTIGQNYRTRSGAE